MLDHFMATQEAISGQNVLTVSQGPVKGSLGVHVEMVRISKRRIYTYVYLGIEQAAELRDLLTAIINLKATFTRGE